MKSDELKATLELGRIADTLLIIMENPALYTRGDLQGAIEGQIRRAYLYGRKEAEKNLRKNA